MDYSQSLNKKNTVNISSNGSAIDRIKLRSIGLLPSMQESATITSAIHTTSSQRIKLNLCQAIVYIFYSTKLDNHAWFQIISIEKYRVIIE